MVITIGEYQIRPHKQSRCWVLFKRTANGNWKETGQYPSNVEMALEIVSNRTLMDGSAEVDESGLLDALSALTRAIADAAQAIDG